VAKDSFLTGTIADLKNHCNHNCSSSLNPFLRSGLIEAGKELLAFGIVEGESYVDSIACRA